jgi:peptidoglycan/LPS O-acetylase OafA/YrhL
LWLITIVAFILNPQIGFEKLMLNLSGLFAFIKWDAYIATGAWSIGNEIVFYVFFPFFIIFSKNNKYVFILLCMILFIIYIYFTFYLLKQDTYLVDQWKIYTNPLNQIIFFLGGG